MPALKARRAGRAARLRLFSVLGLRPRRRTLLRFAAAGGCVLGAVLWRTGAVERGLEALEAEVVSASVAAGFAVDEAFVEGRRHMRLEDVRAALGAGRGDPMLLLDLAAAKARLEANPWVASATVERRLPDIVHVRIVERRPMALWQHRGVVRVVDRAGRVLADRDLADHAALPLVVGADAPAEFPSLMAAVAAAPALYPRLSSASWVGGRRWSLRFDDRVDVLLPEGAPDRAWIRLNALQRKGAILDARLARIDLRGPDRVLVAVEEGAPDPAGETPGREKG